VARAITVFSAIALGCREQCRRVASVRSAVMPTVAVEELSVFRNGGPVIDALDWRVEPGRIAWVVGENGSGKSTLLSVLAGRLRPDGGAVRLNPTPEPGSVVWYHPHMAPPPETRVADWHRFIAQLAPPGATPTLEPELRPRQRLGAVSTGEQRRLLLDALLRHHAGVYLLDEPYEHLSPQAKSVLTQRLQQRAQESVVIVATNQGTAAESAGSHALPSLRLLGGGAWQYAW
jgi:ABC-type multidrug transport system ATPase subunit